MIKDRQFELINSEIWCINPVVVITLSCMKQELPIRADFISVNLCTGWTKMQDYADIKDETILESRVFNIVSICWIGMKLQLENINYNCV